MRGPAAVEGKRRVPFPQLPLSRDDGVALIKTRAEELRAALEELSAEADDAAGPMGWTAADHLMHVVAWHRRLLGWMADEAAGREVVRPEPGYTFEQVDELNDRDLLAARGTPLAEAWRQFDETLTAVLALVESLSDDELNTPGRYRWLPDDGVLWYPVGGNSFDHYEEHIAILGGDDGEAAGGG